MGFGRRNGCFSVQRKAAFAKSGRRPQLDEAHATQLEQAGAGVAGAKHPQPVVFFVYRDSSSNRSARLVSSSMLW